MKPQAHRAFGLESYHDIYLCCHSPCQVFVYSPWLIFSGLHAKLKFTHIFMILETRDVLVGQ